MIYKKIFFPIGGGEELEERIYGALLVNKFFGSHLSVISCQLDPQEIYNVRMTLRGGISMSEFIDSAKEELITEQNETMEIFKKKCKELGVSFDENQHTPNSAFLRNLIGTRSDLVEKHSKYCDLIVAAVPPTGVITGTFEAAVMKSGKSAIIIPRTMTEFKIDKILVSLTGSISSSRALTNSIPLLKQAKEVHCITSKHYLQESMEETKGRIENYLDIHGIKPSFEVVNTEGKIPGQVLLDSANSFGANLIVAGIDADSGLKEIFLGGASKFFLRNTKIPIFV
ncbi:universal stress protein [Campylobacter sp. FMV-PI01]|uniref:Universal stress protein n=1 Tax=Campylobacter portucalensis TaxID=2608384 RepID=A0A6L5WI49_9BACT|nr:universal stress protein [Campylobacter portucalensis]MSN96938.1 universal stress protein [Campylobacter portucalensis]